MGGVPSIEFAIRFFVWLAAAGFVMAFIITVLEHRNGRTTDRRSERISRSYKPRGTRGVSQIPKRLNGLYQDGQ